MIVLVDVDVDVEGDGDGDGCGYYHSSYDYYDCDTDYRTAVADNIKLKILADSSMMMIDSKDFHSFILVVRI